MPPAVKAPMIPVTSPRIERGAGDERGAVADQGEQPRLGRAGARGPTGDLRDAEPHRQRDDQVGEAAQGERDVHRRQLRGGATEQRAGAGEQGEQAGSGDHGDAVGHHQRELVRRLHLVRAAQQVGHRRVLGRDPEQRAQLDQEHRDEQPPQRPDDRDRDEQAEPEQVTGDHHPAPVELVGQRAGQRAEHQGRQQLGRDDAAEGEALGLVPAGQLGGQGGEREQAQPVADRPRPR